MSTLYHATFFVWCKVQAMYFVCVLDISPGLDSEYRKARFLNVDSVTIEYFTCTLFTKERV